MMLIIGGGVKEFIYIKIKKLIIPYLACGLFYCLFWVVFYGYNISIIKHMFWNNTNGMSGCGALWFLTFLFLIEIIYHIISVSIPQRLIKTILIIFILIGYILSKMKFSDLIPWAFLQVLINLGFFHIGQIFKRYEKNIVIIHLYNMTICEIGIYSVICTGLIFLNDYVNVRCNMYGCLILFYFNAITAIIVGLNISKIIYIKFRNGKIVKELSYIGRNSMIYLCFNQFILIYICKFIALKQLLILESIIKLFLNLIILHFIVFAKDRIRKLLMIREFNKCE